MNVLLEILLIGSVSGLITVGIGFITAKMMFGRARATINAEFDSFMVAKVTGFLKLLHDNPENFAPIANGFLSDLSKIVKVPEFQIGGQMVNGDTIGAILPIIPKKWRGLVAIGQMFLKQSGSAPTEQKSGLHGN